MCTEVFQHALSNETTFIQFSIRLYGEMLVQIAKTPFNGPLEALPTRKTDSGPQKTYVCTIWFVSRYTKPVKFAHELAKWSITCFIRVLTHLKTVKALYKIRQNCLDKEGIELATS